MTSGGETEKVPPARVDREGAAAASQVSCRKERQGKIRHATCTLSTSPVPLVFPILEGGGEPEMEPPVRIERGGSASASQELGRKDRLGRKGSGGNMLPHR
jgi:hypothetical protein